MVKYLCEVVGVSRSGYYNYYTEKAKQNRTARDQADEEVKAIILKAFHFRRRKKGARQIKMTLNNQYGITYNLKRIRRISLTLFVRFEKPIHIVEWLKQPRNIVLVQTSCSVNLSRVWRAKYY